MAVAIAYLSMTLQLSREGWTVRRAGLDGNASRGGDASAHGVPILVHRGTDERTLTAAIQHLKGGSYGEFASRTP